MVPVIALMLFMGLLPASAARRMEPSVTAMLARVNLAAETRLERTTADSNASSPACRISEPAIGAAVTDESIEPRRDQLRLAADSAADHRRGRRDRRAAGGRARRRRGERGLGWLTLALLGVAFVFALGIVGQNGIAFAGSIAIDSFSAFFELVILIAAMFTVLMSLDYVAERRIAGAEYYSLVLFAALGMMLMATAGDLISHLSRARNHVALGLRAGRACAASPQSTEAALKYFMLGAFSTGFLLYGIALVYGATGTIKLGPIHDGADPAI